MKRQGVWTLGERIFEHFFGECWYSNFEFPLHLKWRQVGKVGACLSPQVPGERLQRGPKEAALSLLHSESITEWCMTPAQEIQAAKELISHCSK